MILLQRDVPQLKMCVKYQTLLNSMLLIRSEAVNQAFRINQALQTYRAG